MARVRFLGSGDAFGSGGRLQTCIMVEGADTRFLVDCGPSCLIAMRRFGVDPNDLDAILLTHLHGDHFGGVPFFLLDAQHVSRRDRPLVVAGPPGSRQRIHDACEILFAGSTTTAWRFPLEFRELEPGRAHALGALEVTPFEMVHNAGAPSTALRVVVDGKVVTYTGDTEWNENLIPAARDADLFIAETYTFDRAVRYHSTYRRWMDELARLAPKRFVATHMSTNVLRRLDELECETADDGKVFEV